MNQIGAVVTFKSQPGKGKEVAHLVAAALPQALNEEPMPLWLVLHSEEDPDIVHIADVVVDKAGRENHLRDATAAQILATVPPYLAEPVKISPMEVVAAKGLVVS